MTTPTHATLLAAALALLPASSALASGATFSASFSPDLRNQPASGRLVIFLIREGAMLAPNTDPIDGPFWEDPQPMFGDTISAAAPGQSITLGPNTTSFGFSPATLPPGSYRAQALLDLHRLNSSWQREPGNLFSDPVQFTIPDNATAPIAVHLPLTRMVEPAPADLPDYASEFRIRSTLLSDFAGRDVDLIAAVVPPRKQDPARKHPVIYLVPGFGGDHTELNLVRALRAAPPGSPAATLADHAFIIALNPESPNGHTLFIDSEVNGPWGRALTTELIPALEQQFPLEPTPAARLLRGHSSGGWSTVWLATNHPDVFGAAWSTAPDPVDFRRFQLVDIYTQPSMYSTTPGPRPDVEPLKPLDGDIPSYRRGPRARMTIAQENAMEEVLGPANTSAQQWDSWFAAFGPRDPAGPASGFGIPAPLFNARTGELDHAIAQRFQHADISLRLRNNPAAIGPILKQRVRLLCGAVDNFYLEEAVKLLARELESLSFLHLPEGEHGVIKILPGRDHGSIFADPQVAKFPAQMLEHLQRNNLIPTN